MNYIEELKLENARLKQELDALKPKKMTEQELLKLQVKRLREARERQEEIEDLYKAQGICPSCQGEGELGGQFTGGTWPCEICNATGKYYETQ